MTYWYRPSVLTFNMKTPVLVDFDKEYLRNVINFEELNAEIVDLQDEGIALPNNWTKKALKIKLGAGETKYLKLFASGLWEEQQYYILCYCTGDAKVEHNGAWVGTNPVINLTNRWAFLTCRMNSWQTNSIKLSSTNGGNVYIAQIAVPENPHTLTIQSYPNQSLDGTTTYTYYISLPVYGKQKGKTRVRISLAGDGTNPATADVFVKTNDDGTFKLVGSVSRVANTIGLYNIPIPYKIQTERNIDVQFIIVKINVSGYGLFYQYNVSLYKYDTIDYNFNGKVSNSASNATTTVTNYVLLDTNGRLNKYLQGSVSLDGTYGTAKLYINDKLVLDASGTTATFTIPENLEIYKISVDLAGDGTNPATASFEGLELQGPYWVVR